MGRAFEYRRASKEKRWDKMSRIFPKLSRAITIAAKEGGTDYTCNPKLRSAILNAKAQNMPKDNIESAIKRANGKDGVVYSEIHYEGKGLHGVLFFVECTTDNPTRTVANVKAYFSKCNGQVVNNGSLEFMFSRKAVFQFEKTQDLDLDELELNLIDAGLEEIEVVENDIFVYGDFINFGNLSQAFEDLGIEIKKANLQRIPTSTVQLTEEQLVDIEKLIDKLEEDDDVQDVFTNIE